MTAPNMIEAISRAYGLERTTVEAAIARAMAGDVAALLCVGINLNAEQLPADPDARREAIEWAIARELNAK